jgi:hypothetical protein
LLAAEDGTPADAASWPVLQPEPSRPAITDEFIEDIVRRVLDRLTDRAVRETTADIVSRVAEQLVRDEIDKIRKAIK